MRGNAPLKNSAGVSRGALILGLIAAGTAGIVSPAFAQSTAPAETTAPSETQSDRTPATAADTSPAGPGDIIVTATRQSLGSQRVPISMTAVGAPQLAKEGITSAAQLNQLSPSLYVLSAVSEGSPRFTLRGLTFTDTQATGSPAVATYVDDVYQSFQFGIYTSLYDLQRVEILRGPQGTTFGRNTTGGAVAYFSQTPANKWEGSLSARVAAGDQGQQYVEGMVNIPLIDDKLALRISGHSEWRDDYVRDLTTGRQRGSSNAQSGRIQLRFTPDNETSANLTVFGLRRRGDAPVPHGQVYPGGVVAPGYAQLSPLDLHDNFDNVGATLRIEHTGGLLTLTSISHYRNTLYNTAQDLDGFPDGGVPGDDFSFPQGFIPDTLYRDRALAKQYGQEIRISSDPTRRISGILGAYYEHDNVYDQINYADVIDGLGLDYNNYFPYRVTTNAYAVFGNLKFNVTDAISVIGGIRKSVEKKTDSGTSSYFLDYNYDWTQNNIQVDGVPPVPSTQFLPYRLSQTSKPLTWDATINYNPSSTLLIFARVAKGFRSGGFNPPAFIATPALLPAPVPLTYTGESVRSYEAGIKLGLLDNRLRINASAFHYNYTNQQVTDYSAGFPITRNAGRSKVDGGEIEVTAAPVKALELRGSVSYTNARYTQYAIVGSDYSGNTLQQSPKWTVNGSANYILPIDRTFNLDADTTWSYRSRVFFDSQNSAELTGEALTTGNVRLALVPVTGKGLAVAAFVNNLTNRRPLASGFSFIPDVQYVKFFDTGRLFGVDVSYKW